MRQKYKEPSMQIVILQFEVITLASGGDYTAPEPDGNEKDWSDIFE